jgi:hypothetical protein
MASKQKIVDFNQLVHPLIQTSEYFCVWVPSWFTLLVKRTNMLASGSLTPIIPQTSQTLDYQSDSQAFFT